MLPQRSSQPSGSSSPWWLGAALWGVAFNHGFMGEFERGLAAAREAGVLLGKKDLLQAAWINSAPHHAFGRAWAFLYSPGARARAGQEDTSANTT